MAHEQRRHGHVGAAQPARWRAGHDHGAGAQHHVRERRLRFEYSGRSSCDRAAVGRGTAREERGGQRDEGETAVIVLLRPDLRIDFVNVEDLSQADRRLTVRVRNNSGLPIAGATLALRRGDANGELLTTLTIPDELPPDGYHDVPWVGQAAGPFPHGIAPVWAMVDPAQAVDEFDETNNAQTVLVQGAILVDDCNGNGFSDTSDIAAGKSADCNANCVPDEVPRRLQLRRRDRLSRHRLLRSRDSAQPGGVGRALCRPARRRAANLHVRQLRCERQRQRRV
jgi:hypothetical protein